MADVSFEANLAELLECNGCHVEAKQQKVLACQHSLCMECMRKLKVCKRRFKCSICTKESLMPNGGFDELPDSLITKQIADLMETDSTACEAEATCDKQASEDPKEDAGAPLIADVDSRESDESTRPKSFAGGREGDNIDRVSNMVDPQVPAQEAEKKPEVNHEHLRKLYDLKAAVTKAENWLSKVEILKQDSYRKIKRIESECQKTKDAITKYQSDVVKLCEEKIQALTEVEKAQRDSITSIRDKHHPKIAQMKSILNDNAEFLDSVPSPPKIRSRGRKPKRPVYDEKDIPRAEELTKELQNLPEVESSNYGDTSYGYYGSVKRGDRVRLNIKYPTQNVSEFANSNVTHCSIGVVQEAGSYNSPCTVIFPDNITWKGAEEALMKTEKKSDVPYIGDRVRLKEEKDLKRGYYGYRERKLRGKRGTLSRFKEDKESDDERTHSEKQKEDYDVIVDISSDEELEIRYSYLEKVPGCGMEIGDKVRVNHTISVPSGGLQGINASSVGVVTSVVGQPGSEVVTANFPGCPEWSGESGDLEVRRNPTKGDKVQVKLDIDKPKLDWSGVTHSDIGTLEEIVHDRRGPYKKLAKISFPRRSIPWYCVYDEIEMMRYQQPTARERPSPSPSYQYVDYDSGDVCSGSSDGGWDEDEERYDYYYGDSDDDGDTMYMRNNFVEEFQQNVLAGIFAAQFGLFQ